MNLRILKPIATLLFFLLIVTYQPVVAQSTATLKHGDLRAVFVDNSSYGEHLKGYNGISELYHKKQDSTLFVPLFAGFNLEHIFDGDSLISFFEPRREPMTLNKKSDTKVVLHQPKTRISKVESWTTFEMVGPHYIDVEFRFIVHDPEMFDHGYVGFFWASYINLPKIPGIYFKGRKHDQTGGGDWLYAFSEEHGKNGTHISVKDTFDFYQVPNFNIDLAKEISEYAFTKPYYYGRFHNMVFGYLFPEPEEGVIRLSQSPNGAGEGNPAWDFQYILPDFEVGKPYSFKTRVLYKEWVSQRDIEEEYEKWIRENE